jgi:fermentation-respiration switch protein FrsA (DUF1100 family)
VKVRIPILFIVGLNEEVIPPTHTNQLFNAAEYSVFKHKHFVPGGTHNDTWIKGGKDYMFSIKDFIEKVNELKQ